MIIISIILKLVAKYRNNKNNQIPYALWTYKTSIKTPIIGAIPFSLVYGDDNDIEVQSYVSQVLGINEANRVIAV